MILVQMLRHRKGMSLEMATCESVCHEITFVFKIGRISSILKYLEVEILPTRFSMAAILKSKMVTRAKSYFLSIDILPHYIILEVQCMHIKCIKSKPL